MRKWILVISFLLTFFKLKFQKTPQNQELLIGKANSSSEVLKLSHWLSVPGVRAPEFKFLTP